MLDILSAGKWVCIVTTLFMKWACKEKKKMYVRIPLFSCKRFNCFFFSYSFVSNQYGQWYVRHWKPSFMSESVHWKKWGCLYLGKYILLTKIVLQFVFLSYYLIPGTQGGYRYEIWHLYWSSNNTKSRSVTFGLFCKWKFVRKLSNCLDTKLKTSLITSLIAKIARKQPLLGSWLYDVK